jgi:hypothetical protein
MTDHLFAPVSIGEPLEFQSMRRCFRQRTSLDIGTTRTIVPKDQTVAYAEAACPICSDTILRKANSGAAFPGEFHWRDAAAALPRQWRVPKICGKDLTKQAASSDLDKTPWDD